MKKLTELQKGETAVLQAVNGDQRLKNRIFSIGLTVGSQLEVLQNRKKQPVLVYARDTMIAIGRNEAEKLEVGV